LLALQTQYIIAAIHEMDYRHAVDFLLERTDYERWPGYAYASRFDLRRMEDLLQRLGNPHLHARSIHVAGSKGKGSTAAMVSAGLVAAGYKTGLYTSPHLVTLRERIRVNGKPIQKRELVEVVTGMRPHVEEMDRQSTYGELTTFELLTAAAFLHFKWVGVDFQVLEVGLGGRLDATNIVTPAVSVITSISLDHTEVLGDTLALIAGEKAGIVKLGIPVVSSPQNDEAASVINKTCLQREAALTIVGKDITWEEIRANHSGQALSVKGLRDSYQLTIPLLGYYQLQNAATAIAVLEKLGIPGNSIETGLARTSWPGRLQILRRRPLLVVDGAHSGDSAKRLREALRRHFHFDKVILIIGMSADKNMSAIVDELAPIADGVIATQSRHPRAASPAAVAGEFSRIGAGMGMDTADSVAQAIVMAQERAGKRDLILATGSLFLVGEVIEYVRGLRPELYPQ
jgi:dihydrofolate synthase/folylpolyglutamate synthase